MIESMVILFLKGTLLGLLIMQNNNFICLFLCNTIGSNYILCIFNIITVPNTDLAQEVLKNIRCV